MIESMIIKNFGPIKDIELEEIKPLTIFIGESGSGKSSIMKVLLLFRWIYKMVNIRSYLKHSKISKSPFRFKFESYIKNNGFEKYINNDTVIIYKKNNIEIKYINKKLDARATVEQADLCLDKMCFISDKRNMIPDLVASKKKASIDSFFLKETYQDFINASENNESLMLDFFNIKLSKRKTNQGTRYYIDSINSNLPYSIPFEDSSSGMQTVTPASLIIDYFTNKYDFVKLFNKSILQYMSENDTLQSFKPVQNIGDIKHKYVHLHIEEPELSLFPETQRSFMNYIIKKCFTSKPEGYNITLMLTTHSPYIVNHINLLIMAHNKNTSIEGASISFNDVKVYEITDGHLCDLSNDEGSFIDTRALSEPISDIYEQYNELKNNDTAFTK